ncbi:MAG: nuclear transport factor 2 family protein [Actinomycetota bacterium]|nr:nuclear transport factor 2 family protein [Actinomycetota bacterium]
MNNQLTEVSPDAERTSLVERLYGAIAAGDVDGAVSVLAPDVELHVPGTHQLAGEHRGPDAVVAFAAATRALTDDGEHIEVLDVLEGRDHVAVLAVVRAERDGRAPLENRTVHVLATSGGRIDAIWLHNFDDVAVNEFWS